MDAAETSRPRRTALRLTGLFAALFATLCVGIPIFVAIVRTAEPPADVATPSAAWEALSFWSDARAYPFDDIPPSGFAQAFDKKERAASKSQTDEPPWRTIGPHNIAGRMLSVVFNPERDRTLLAGSASGGLWRSYTAGEGATAWHRVALGFPALSIAAVAYAPGDSNVIFLGTGEVYNPITRDGRGISYRPTRGHYGTGILRSRDAGATWERSLDWTLQQQRGVAMIRFNPKNPSTVWAATTDGILVSRDGGDSWTTSLDVVMGSDIAINPVDTSIVFAAAGNLGSPGHGLYRSRDGGATWGRMTGEIPVIYRGKALFGMAPSDPNIVYASIGNGFSGGDGNWLVRTVDGGDTWTEMNSVDDWVSAQGWYSHDVTVDPSNPDRITVIGFLIHSSADGGKVLTPRTAWNGFGKTVPPIGAHDGPENYTHPDHHAVEPHPTDPDYLLFATDGGIYRTQDDGATYRALNGGLQTVQFYSGMSSGTADTSLAIAGTQDNTSMVYRGTLEWRFLVGGDGAWTGVDPTNNRRFYWSSQYLNMRTSADRGISTAVRVAPPTSGSSLTGFIAPFVLTPSNPSRLFAGRDVVYLTDNRGTNWRPTNGGQPLSGDPLISMAASHGNSDVVYAVTAPGGDRARVFRTHDAGTTWSDVTTGLPDRYLMDIAIHPDDDAIALMAIGGFGTPRVWGTTNSGGSWQPLSEGLPDVPTFSVAFDPAYPDTVFAGNEVGVYVSRDRGSSWVPFSEGLPEAVIAMDLSVSPQNRELRVATHGNGMFARRLTGSAAASEAPEAEIRSFDVLSVYPNPVIDAARVSYFLSQPSDVRVVVYDALGREIDVLMDGAQPAGRHFLDANFAGVPAGVYFVHISAPSLNTTRSVVHR